METTYEFSAYNTESIYGFGTEIEATQYLAWLNKTREINLFEISIANLTSDEADTLAFNLRDNLNDLDLIVVA